MRCEGGKGGDAELGVISIKVKIKKKFLLAFQQKLKYTHKEKQVYIPIPHQNTDI